jgi:hypothetical protein
MATAGRLGMGLITMIITVHTITAVCGGRMLMYSDITTIAGTIMILPIEGSRAARLGAHFMEVADSTEGEALHTAGAVGTEEEATEVAGMADDSNSPIL